MSTQSSAVKEPETMDYRLPRTAIPSRYQIRLCPDLETFKFGGQVIIECDLKEPCSQITLNSLDLKILSASATNGKKTLDAKHELIVDAERLKLSFPEPLEKGAWQIEIKYEGELNDKLHGFYRSSYTDQEGKKRFLGTTQFEATDARRAFPCFDEPDFKAVYKITLVIDEKLTAISNSSIVSEKPLADGKKEVEFKDTIKMSTYLVAFVIGDFEACPQEMAGKTPVRVWSIRGKNHLSGFAMKSGVHALKFFENYYGVPYAGEKLDLIAIPDFAFGAMENLGCVTFRESALLVDENAASHAELERIADVVAHEIAHMWFGDLTTMSWWNGIWLNEAFATFAEMLAVDDFKPEWKRWVSFGVSRASALLTDGLKSTRPIEFPVHHPHECEAMFDVLTYEKGASVLRMLEQYLDKDQFKNGVSHYLNKHQFANTETSDLWDAIEHVSKEPVRKLMDSWIFQKGYPVISVALDESGKKLNLKQERFFYLADSPEKQVFHVPLLIEIKTDKGKASKKLLLTEETGSIEFDGKLEYAIVNAGGHGFYRVSYASNLLEMISEKVFEKLSSIERFNLVNDSWAMTISGYISLTDYLKMLKNFKDETDKNVWSIISGSLSYLDRIVGEKERPLLAAYTCALLGPVLARLGWETKADEDELCRQLRAIAVSSLGTIGDCKETQQKAQELYRKFRENPASVDPNLVPALITVSAACGDEKLYKEFVELWQAGKTPQDEERYLFALAAFKQEPLLRQTLAKTTSGEVRTQNAPYLLRSVMVNTSGRKLAWEHMSESWDYIMSKYPDNSIARMLEGITALVCPQMEKDVLKFLREHPVKQGGKTIEQHLERLHVAVKFKERESSNLEAALKQ